MAISNAIYTVPEALKNNRNRKFYMISISQNVDHHELKSTLLLFSTHPCPILSILVYFLLGSPIDTIVRSFSSISSSVIFFFLGRLSCLPAVVVAEARGVPPGVVGWNLGLSSAGSMGFVYYGQ